MAWFLWLQVQYADTATVICTWLATGLTALDVLANWKVSCSEYHQVNGQHSSQYLLYCVVTCVLHCTDMSFLDICLDSILDNLYESAVFKDYLNSKGWSGKDLVVKLCEMLDSGALSITYRNFVISPATVVCLTCTNDIVRGLIYDYRRSIPDEEFPESVTSRPNCNLGRECITQYTDLTHARCVWEWSGTLWDQ